MISPELLKKYAFFGLLNDSQLRALAMIAGEVSFDAGVDILDADAPVDGLYLLISGQVDLYAVSQDKHEPQLRKEFLVGEVSPGEPFGLGALVEPHHSIALVRANTACKAIRIEAPGLRALCEVDRDLGYTLARQVARAAMERLAYTQAQLAAARA